MPYLPNIPLPVREKGKPKPAIDSDVIHKQLVDVLEHRFSASKDAVESSPTSSYGTAYSELNDETDVQATPSKGPKPTDGHDMNATPSKTPKRKPSKPYLISHAFLRDVPEGHKTTSKVQKVPIYPMNKENIKPYEVWVSTSNIPAKYLYFAFLDKDQKDYIAALQDNWNNTSVPPIRPEAPLGTTLNATLNYHSLDTMERIPPDQLFRSSNFRCVQIVEAWERELVKEDVEPDSEREIQRNTNIHKCREMREELLAQRSQVEETISTKILIGRAVWQHEAFKQIKRERDRVEELEAKLAKERKEKAAAEAALLKIVDEERAKGHAKNLEAFAKHINQELAENYALLNEWDIYQSALAKEKEPLGTPGKPVDITMFMSIMSYIQNRRIGLEQEKQLLGKFVDIRTFRHDKGNLIRITMEKIVESLAINKQDVEARLEEAKDLLVCGSTATSPGFPGLPSPPPGAAMYDSVEDMEKKIAKLEVERLHTMYEQGVAETFTKFWQLYHQYKMDMGEPLDLEDDSEEDEEDEEGEREGEKEEYEGDDDYEEDPCPNPTAAQFYGRPPIVPEEQSMQWLYDVISHAVKLWTGDVFRMQKSFIAKQEEVNKLTQSCRKATQLLKRSMYQRELVGRDNRRLREKVKGLESQLAEYIDFMQKIGIESDKDSMGTEECLYTSIQSLHSLKDENLRLKLLIDGLNGKVEELNRALDLCKEALVPWPSANRLEESLAESLQVYDHAFAQHKSWLRGFGKIREDSEVEESASAETKEEVDLAAEVQEGLNALAALNPGLDVLSASSLGFETPKKAQGGGSIHSSPRRKPPVADDEHSLAGLEAVERMNVETAWKRRGGDEQSIKEVEAMMGLTKLKHSSRFVERFEEEWEYARLVME